MTRPAKRKAMLVWHHIHRDTEGYDLVESEIVNGKMIYSDSAPGTPLSPCDQGSADQWCKGWHLFREVLRRPKRKMAIKEAESND